MGLPGGRSGLRSHRALGEARRPAINDLDPDKLDADEVLRYIDQYGTPLTIERREAIRQHLIRPASRPAVLDEFERAQIDSIDDIVEPFQHRMFYGCEADDPLIGVGARFRVEGELRPLHPLFGSDVSHWDVPVMNHVLPEAYELFEPRGTQRRRVPRLHLHQCRTPARGRQPSVFRHHRAS